MGRWSQRRRRGGGGPPGGSAACVGLTSFTLIDSDTLDVQWDTTVNTAAMTLAMFTDVNTGGVPGFITIGGGDSVELTGWNTPCSPGDTFTFDSGGIDTGACSPRTAVSI